MERHRGLRLALRKRTVRVVGVSLLVASGFLGLLLWAGDRLAAMVIEVLIKVMFWGFGFGWLKAIGL